jgi:hypothetical protein
MRIPAAWPRQSSPTNQRVQGLSWPRRQALELFIFALIGFLVWQGVVVWDGMYRDITHFPQALNWAIGPQPAGGYTEYTPRVLNRRQPGRAYIGHTVHYVGKEVASTGPFVVSIDAINADNMGLVALGDNGDCYAEFIHSYGPNNQYGSTKYARFPRGTRCESLTATPFTVQLNDEPQ